MVGFYKTDKIKEEETMSEVPYNLDLVEGTNASDNTSKRENKPLLCNRIFWGHKHRKKYWEKIL